MQGTLAVDGGRPAVEWVGRIPHGWTSAGERLVLFAMACDSYDGRTSMPGLDNLARWTGMHRSSVAEAVNRLLAPLDGVRPPLLSRRSTKGGSKVRSTYVLLTETVAEPSGHPDTSTVGEQSPNRPAIPTDISRATVGEPSGQPAPPSPSQETSSPSPAAQLVARLLDLDADDERLTSVDKLLADNGAKNPRAWLTVCNTNGDLRRLLDEAHQATALRAQRETEAARKRCLHGVVNGDRIAGQCPACWEHEGVA